MATIVNYCQKMVSQQTLTCVYTANCIIIDHFSAFESGL
eukprot:COSAG06_NODE_10189_length_1732_cov_1.278016_3_plen_38_part_01